MTEMIRDYEEKDAEDVVLAWRRASALAHPFLTPEFIAAEEIEMRDTYLPHTETWVAESGGKVVGFISLLDTDFGWEVGSLFLDPDYHGRKIGAALMTKAVREKGALMLDVFKENAIGRRFYREYGFEELHEHIHNATGHPLIRMALSPKSQG